MNTELIKQFHEKLVDLEEDEVYLLTGGARKKYANGNPDISTSHEVVTRKLVRHNDFDKFLSIIEKSRAMVALSIDKNTKKNLPQETHVLWMNPNPRSTLKGYNHFKKKVDDHIYELTKCKGDREQHYRQLKKIDVIYHSSIQVSASRKLYSVCDIDVKNITILKVIAEHLLPYIAWITETRGGYHIVYHVEGNGIVYSEGIKQLFGEKVEWLKDQMTYIWGVPQGDFIPKPVYLFELDLESNDVDEQYCCCGGLSGCACDDVCGDECKNKP